MVTREFCWQIAIAVVFSGLVACNHSSLPENQRIQQQVSIESFNSCPQLERYLKDTAEVEMRSILEGYRSGTGYAVEDVRMSAGSPASMSGPDAFTQTNNQVAGVDEGDIVKNDGTRIFFITGRTLYLVNSWPPASMTMTAKLDLEGRPVEMLFDGSQRLAIFSRVSVRDNTPAMGRMCIQSFPNCQYFGSVTKISLIDVSDMSNPRMLREQYLPGNYLSSRGVGSSVRAVLTDAFRWPSEVRWYPEGATSQGNPSGSAWERLIQTNLQAIRNATLEAFLPHRLVKQEDGQSIDVAYSCSEFSRVSAATQLGYVTVATLKMDRPDEPPLRRSIVARAATVYSSSESIYVSTPHWWFRPESGQRDYTYFHKFDVSRPMQVRYVASGGTDGYVANQFSLDELNGYFRVATTPVVWRAANNRWQSDVTNRISVFKENGSALEVVGQSDDIARGERIYSARFIGDKAYVVTFRQIDPLFTFDLRDPTHPRQVGELQVPGFSTYLHPLDDTHLLSMGEYRDPNSRWGSRSVQISIFDVSDFAHPRQSFTQTIGSHNGYSEAEYNHKAFNYFPERKLLAIPMTDWNPSDSTRWGTFTSDLRVFKVDAAMGFVPMGSLSMADIYRDRNRPSWSWYWNPAVRRSVIADNFVYAVSDAAIRVADVESLAAPIQTVQFTQTAF